MDRTSDLTVSVSEDEFFGRSGLATVVNGQGRALAETFHATKQPVRGGEATDGSLAGAGKEGAETVLRVPLFWARKVGLAVRAEVRDRLVIPRVGTGLDGSFVLRKVNPRCEPGTDGGVRYEPDASAGS
ncbi:MAG: hypothetical protein OXR67_17585 [Chloroflexota bacterium]|nr:hypothetical protein [Chloroflexota bacterium]